MANIGTPTLTDPNGLQLTFQQTAAGPQMPVTPTANVLMFDNFNGTVIDTATRWQAPVLAGGGTMTQSAGTLNAATGTTASNAASITSIETFEPTIGNLLIGGLIGIEAAPGLNTSRCLGFYTKPGSFTAATPVQDGYVWEYDITGAFGASIYSGGTRVYRSPTVYPAGSQYIQSAVGFQGLNAFFYYGSFSVPTFTVPIIEASTLNLPAGFHCINHTTPPVGAPTWQLTGTAIVDYSGTLPIAFNGQTPTRVRTPAVFKSLNSVVVTSETTIWTPSAGRKFRLMGGNLTGGVAAGNVVLKDNTGGSALPIILPFGAVGQNIPFVVGGNGYMSATAGNVLTATGASTQTLSGWVYGCEE